MAITHEEIMFLEVKHVRQIITGRFAEYNPAEPNVSVAAVTAAHEMMELIAALSDQQIKQIREVYFRL
jgi:hypothetical protein